MLEILKIYIFFAQITKARINTISFNRLKNYDGIEMKKIEILLTSQNRKNKTLACLDSLFSNEFDDSMVKSY